MQDKLAAHSREQTLKADSGAHLPATWALRHSRDSSFRLWPEKLGTDTQDKR